MRVVPWIVACLVCGLLVGCGDKTRSGSDGESVTSVVENLDPYTVLMDELNALTATGDTNAVLAFYDRVLGDEASVDFHGVVFRQYLYTLLEGEGIDRVKSEVLAIVVPEKEALLQSAAGVVSEYYAGLQDWSAIIEWADQVLALETATVMHDDAWRNKVYALYSAGRYQECPPLIATVAETLPPETFRSVAAQMVSVGMRDQKNLPVLRELLGAIELHVVTVPSLGALILRSEGQLLEMEGRLEALKAFILANIAEIPDRDLRRLVTGVSKLATTAERAEVFDQLVEELSPKLISRERAHVSLMAVWVRRTLDSNQLQLYVKRIKMMPAKGLPPADTIRLFERGFYRVMPSSDKPMKADMMTFGAELLAMGLEEKTRGRMIRLLLDGSFYTSDFRYSLKLLEMGVADEDEEWHEIHINKVTAHLDLQEDRRAEAIAGFRRHMDSVEKWDDGRLANPETGTMMSAESVLAYNEKRIGDIYTSMGQPADATKAYASAVDYYKTAITLAVKSPEEIERLQAELALVPQPAQ